MPPSRNIVIRSPSGLFLKSYGSPESFDAERDNLVEFHTINNARSKAQNDNIPGIEDDQYIRIPFINPNLDNTSRIEDRSDIKRPISVFQSLPGELLYDRMLRGAADFTDMAAAVVQIARIQEEGKFRRRALNLEDVTKDSNGKDSPDHFMNRFEGIFLGRISGKLGISDSLYNQMTESWRTLVAQYLSNSNSPSFINSFYFDGAPVHHVLDAQGKLHSLDFEQKIIAPTFFGLANLLHFGVTDVNGSPMLSQDDLINLVDRFLFEMAYVADMKDEKYKSAARKFKFVSERYKSKAYELYKGTNSVEFYRAIGDGDEGVGKQWREKIYAALPISVIERQAIWIGHKDRYIDVANRLDKPGEQYKSEQRVHLDNILANLRLLEGDPTIKNGTKLAVLSLYSAFEELGKHDYFTQKQQK